MASFSFGFFCCSALLVETLSKSTTSIASCQRNTQAFILWDISACKLSIPFTKKSHPEKVEVRSRLFLLENLSLLLLTVVDRRKPKHDQKKQRNNGGTTVYCRGSRINTCAHFISAARGFLCPVPPPVAACKHIPLFRVYHFLDFILKYKFHTC
jgi:hypothetical protein